MENEKLLFQKDTVCILQDQKTSGDGWCWWLPNKVKMVKMEPRHVSNLNVHGPISE